MVTDKLSMILENLQFAQPYWLWGMLALPVLWGLYALFFKHSATESKLAKFADPHLLPHLMAGGPQQNKQGKRRTGLSLLLWSVLWALALFAMAGPRWDYTEVKAFSPARNLVILLDLSRSMDADDVKPSRLARARQEIADIDAQDKGINIALIAFASVPHVITPLTDDRETLSRLLPSLKTDLVYTQGSNLSKALGRADTMLAEQIGAENHILVISDGGFDDGDAAILNAERNLTAQNVHIHTMGVGTVAGAPVPDGQGSYYKQNGKAVIAKLEQNRLRRIATDGNGIYLGASYLESDTNALFARIKSGDATETDKTTRIWEERFYILLIPFLFLLLPWFRRNAAFPVLLMFMLWNPAPAHAFEWRDLFMNREQQAKQAIEQKQYDEAATKFTDPYRKGVAEYRAGQYEQAAQSFAAAAREGIKTDAAYNRGNAQLMGGKIEDAIKSYENLLKEHPEHEDAKFNLELAKKMLEQQKKQQQQQQQQQNQQNKQNRQNQQNKNQNQKSDQDKQDQKDGSQQQNSDQSKEDNGQSENQQNGQQKDTQKDQENKGQSGQDQKKDQAEQKNAENQEQQKEQQAADKQKDQNDETDDQKEKQQQQAQNQNSAHDQQQPTDQEPKPAKPDQNGKPYTAHRSQQDINADQWLNRLQASPEQFLKNKFYIESQRQNAKKGDKPW